MVQCIFCQTSFQSRAACINLHEQGKKHKGRVAAWQQAQKDRAAWQQRLDKGAEYTAERRAGQAADPKLHTLSAKHILTACMHAFKSKEFSIQPYPEATGKWLDASKRGYGLDR
eukprot:1139897-Pelagomonas_calceolata.AAC.1